MPYLGVFQTQRQWISTPEPVLCSKMSDLCQVVAIDQDLGSDLIGVVDVARDGLETSVGVGLGGRDTVGAMQGWISSTGSQSSLESRDSQIVKWDLSLRLPMSAEREMSVCRPGRGRARDALQRDGVVANIVLDNSAGLVAGPEGTMVVPSDTCEGEKTVRNSRHVRDQTNLRRTCCCTISSLENKLRKVPSPHIPDLDRRRLVRFISSVSTRQGEVRDDRDLRLVPRPPKDLSDRLRTPEGPKERSSRVVHLPNVDLLVQTSTCDPAFASRPTSRLPVERHDAPFAVSQKLSVYQSVRLPPVDPANSAVLETHHGVQRGRRRDGESGDGACESW